MSKKKYNHRHKENMTEEKENSPIAEDMNENVVEPEVEDVAANDGEEGERESLEGEILKLNQELENEKKEYLFLRAEFDNYRKRTLKEKSELIKNAGEQVFKGLLPIVDDFERGLKATDDSQSTQAVREGMELIYNKLKKFMEQNGVKEFDPNDKDFDADKHEAIAMVPAADEDQKGKIIDTVEKGYTINDKVLRHAKVVVAQK